MDLERPERLLLLLAAVALAAGYVVLQVQRRGLARRWADDALQAGTATARPGPLRHLPAVLVLLAITAMTVGTAGPSLARDVQVERATVVVALDTSSSMLATDVAPDRFTAAKQAATAFVDDLPDGFAVALVGFHGTATLHVPATTDKAAVTRAIDGLTLSGGTALGDAVLTSLSALRTPEDQAVGAVVLLADGGNTAGSPLTPAAERAAADGVPVTTIAYGTADGVVVSGDAVFRVPVDEPVLADLAARTGGEAYVAATGADLSSAYDGVRTRLTTERVQQDVSAVLAGAALALLLGAAVAALVDRAVHSSR